ncbi:hepatocyte nuclear factor 3-beta [Topomyia yanbarensis]|uniref:hepatocyte nuclear factor 3-beta n=1 Tax=Topomyia yanbarensis TaxID=2498891 RepID=UPI00273CF209|nr:hepatocyte nuclear factor 3-beta [Topomyia yanbarensis]
MTQLEDDVLLNNLLKFPGTIIIYNNDLNSYNYVLNGHNSIPLTTGSTPLPDGSMDLNGAVSINVETIPSEPPLESPATSTNSLQSQHDDICSASNSSLVTESAANTSGSINEDYDGEEMDVDEDSEPELTNLSWLTELKNITNLTPSDIPLTDLPTARFNKFIAQVRRSRESYDKRKEQFTALSNCEEKPPFNYAQIIAMAMLDEGRMTLKQICKWIQEKFIYYKVHKNWNNSIRHNLSLSFYFTKVSRAKDEKGKGGYWELSMDASKSERKRIRVRQRNRGKSAGSSTRSRNRLRKTNNNSKSTINNNLQSPDKSSSGGSPDGNNNNNNSSDTIFNKNTSAESISVDDQIIQTVTMDTNNPSDSINEQVYKANESSEMAMLEDQLIKTSALVENCAINFDSIINAETNGNIFTTLNVDEIFSGNEIPQPANDDIIVPFFGTNGQQTIQTGPNVIVETIPYFLPDMGNFDEQDFGNLININEQEISDEFLNEHGFL